MKTGKRLKRTFNFRISEKKFAFWTIAISLVMNAGAFIHVAVSIMNVLFYVLSLIAYFKYIRNPKTLKRTSAVYVVIFTLTNLFSIFSLMALVLALIMSACGYLDFQELITVI